MIGGGSVSWLHVHLPQSVLRRLQRNSHTNSLCRGLERFKRLVGVNRTRSEAVQEQPVILIRAQGPPPKLGQPFHILVCQENRTTTTVRFGRVELL